MTSQEKAQSIEDKFQFTDDPTTFTIQLTVLNSRPGDIDVLVQNSCANPLNITDIDHKTLWLAGAGLGKMLEDDSESVLELGQGVYKAYEDVVKRSIKPRKTTKKKKPPTKSGKGSKKNG